MLCSKCGNDLFELSFFCPQCGKANDICILEKKGVHALSEIYRKEEKELERKFELVHIKVSDHVFHNDMGMQTILYQIKMRENEFRRVELSLKRHRTGSGYSICVYANTQLLGCVPSGQVKYLLDNWSRIDGISDFSVFGGTKLFHNQCRAKCGIEVTIRLYKKMINIDDKKDAYGFFQKTS